jgi:hypothetical protein
MAAPGRAARAAREGSEGCAAGGVRCAAAGEPLSATSSAAARRRKTQRRSPLHTHVCA